VTRVYDIRPDLAGYDALTLRGIAKFAGYVAIIFGVQFLADHYGVAFWLHAAINLVKAGLGLGVIWLGLRHLVSGRELPGGTEGPRYSEPDRIHFISPRMAAAGTILAGAVLVAEAILRMLQF
jgi:hypothetical protein